MTRTATDAGVTALTADLVPAAHALLTRAMGSGWWSAASFAADVGARDRIWLAAVDDRDVASPPRAVLGVAGARRIAGEAELLALGVAAGHRGHGLGRRLLVELAAAAAAGGADRLFLEVRAGNRAARALYRSVGLRRTGRRPGYYADGEDAVLMATLLRHEGGS